MRSVHQYRSVAASERYRPSSHDPVTPTPTPPRNNALSLHKHCSQGQCKGHERQTEITTITTVFHMSTTDSEESHQLLVKADGKH